MENYVTLSLEKYDELNTKAKRFDELKEKFGASVEKTLNDAINNLANYIENITKDFEENNDESEEK